MSIKTKVDKIYWSLGNKQVTNIRIMIIKNGKTIFCQIEALITNLKPCW